MDNVDDLKEIVKDQFGRHAQKYVTSESHARGEDLASLVTWLHPQPEWIVLDVATGGGHVAKALSPFVKCVVASDLTREMLVQAEVHLTALCCENVAYVEADAENLPFESNTFDAVTCRIAPHHFPAPDQFVREAARVLQLHGKFLLIDNVAPDCSKLAVFMNTVEQLRDNSHVRCPSIKEWEEWLREAGLVIVRENLSRKTHRFPEWVERATADLEQIERVEVYLRNASDEARSYFAIESVEGRIQSMQVDEWMVLCEKTGDRDR